MGECKDQILGSCELLGFTSLQLRITGQRTIKESFREESTLEEYVMDTNDDEEQEAERPHKRRRVPRSRVGGKTMKETSVDVGDTEGIVVVSEAGVVVVVAAARLQVDELQSPQFPIT